MQTIIKNHTTGIEIKERHHKFYAIVKYNGKTLGTSENFNTQAAASMAGELLIERYKDHLHLAL